MPLPRSKVERLAINLRRLAVVLFILWIAAAIAALIWVDNEFAGEAPVWRYITAVADMGTFLIASVLAYTGSAIVQAVGRVRSSIISAMFEQTAQNEYEASTAPTFEHIDR